MCICTSAKVQYARGPYYLYTMEVVVVTREVVMPLFSNVIVQTMISFSSNKCHVSKTSSIKNIQQMNVGKKKRCKRWRDYEWE